MAASVSAGLEIKLSKILATMKHYKKKNVPGETILRKVLSLYFDFL